MWQYQSIEIHNITGFYAKNGYGILITNGYIARER